MRQKSIIAGSELVAVGEISLLKVLRRVIACQCCSESVSRSFGTVMVEVLGAAGSATEFVLCGAAKCPNCAEPIVENTLVRCEGERDEDVAIMPDDLCLDDTNVILIDEPLLAEAEAAITGCEHCVANAEMTFEYILDAITEHDPTTTEYVICRPAKCPRCAHEITEKSLIIAE